MIKKVIGFLSLSLVLALTSCKESVADKITDADVQAMEAEKALSGKAPKVELDKKEHDFVFINYDDLKPVADNTVYLLKNAAENFSTIRKIVLNLIKSSPEKISVNRKRKKCAADHQTTP